MPVLPSATMLKFVVLVALSSAVLALPQPRSVPSLDGRIVGGSDVGIEDYKYQASLLYFSSHICGAVIISDTWIVTAGHCVESVLLPTLFLSVRVGSSSRGSGGVVLSVSSYVLHPQYSSSALDYDVAVIQLSSAISHENAEPVTLPPTGPGPVAGQVAVVTGWGTLSESGSLANTLQAVEVPIVSIADCRNAYGAGAVSERMVCAGYLDVGGKDACQGDSGGPLTIGHVLIGLVSWGSGCARPDYPGVYSNVPALREWIRENSGV